MMTIGVINLSELPYAVLIMGMIFVGLYISNLLYDANIPQYISRKIGHGAGGMGLLLCMYMFENWYFPLVLTAGFTLILALARMTKPNTFRGVGGTGRPHALAELWFPLASTISIIIGWVIFNNRYLAIIPTLYMAWGDMVTGLIRAKFYGKEVKGLYGSIGMIFTCLVISFLFPVYWIGVIGSVVATLAEKYTPLSHGMWDDNWTIIIGSLVIMGGLSLL